MTPEEEQKKRIQNETDNNTVDRILFRDPKKFVISTRIYIEKYFFALRLNIGDQPETFALPPHIAKILSHFLSLSVTNYERIFGEILVDLNVKSPLQSADLNKPDSDNSGDSPDSKQPKRPDSGKPKK